MFVLCMKHLLIAFKLFISCSSSLFSTPSVQNQRAAAGSVIKSWSLLMCLTVQPAGQLSDRRVWRKRVWGAADSHWSSPKSLICLSALHEQAWESDIYEPYFNMPGQTRFAYAGYLVLVVLMVAREFGIVKRVHSQISDILLWTDMSSTCIYSSKDWHLYNF